MRALLAILAIALAGCTSPVRPDPVQSALDAAAPPALLGAMLDTLAPTNGYANTRILMPPTGCTGASRPHPVVVTGTQAGPVVGEEFRLTFFASAMRKSLPPGVTIGPDAMWLAIAHDVAWAPRPAPWPGCWQLVNPDTLLPIGIAQEWQGAVRRQPATSDRIELRWTPPAGTVGAVVQLQLLVFAPGITPSGFDVSPAVEITVGTQ